MLSFFLSLTLNNTRIPTPAPANNPDNNVPNVIIPSRYIWVITIEDAQLGIKPMNADNIGPKIGLLRIKFINASSPIISIPVLKTKVIKNTKKNTSKMMQQKQSKVTKKIRVI